VLFAGLAQGAMVRGAPMLGQNCPSLAWPAPRGHDPASAAQAVLQGIEPPVAGRGPKMPGFANSLTNDQISAVLAYARARYTNAPAWKALPAAVTKARQESVEP
jgi:mono/diheme cytochrome c family protein